jgi:hypothetical protein
VIALWSILAIAAVSPANETGSRYAEVFGAFKQACSNLTSYAVAKRNVETLGWIKFSPEPNSTQANQINYKKHGFKNVLAQNAYSKEMGGITVHLFLMRAIESTNFDREDFWDGNRCTVRDATILAMPPAPFVVKWANRTRRQVANAFSGWDPFENAPTSLEDYNFGDPQYRFEPGIGSNISTTTITIRSENSISPTDGVGLELFSTNRRGKE